MEETSLDALFGEIHAENSGYAKLTPKEFRKEVIKRKLVPTYLEQHKDTLPPDVSEEDVIELIRRAHIEYMGRLFPADGFEAKFHGDDFVSKQKPFGEFHNCYRRYSKGLTGARTHTLTYKGTELFSVLYYGCPVPNSISGFKTRLDATIENLNSLPGDKIVDIRLLSPLPEKGPQHALESKLAPSYFTTLTDRDQLLEMAIAAELSNKNIILFNFGVNYGKWGADELQTLLNIRALKRLFALMSNDISTSEKYKLELSDTVSEEVLKATFLAQLKTGNSGGYEKLPQDAENTSASEKQKKLYKDVMKLLKGGVKNNFKIATKLARLAYLLKNHGIDTVSAGCNDGKDRTGEFAVRMETNEYVKHIRGFFSLPEKQQTKKINGVRKVLRQHSTPALAAQAVSMGGYAKGLDTKENPQRNKAKYFKHAYKDPSHVSLWKRIKRKFKSVGRYIHSLLLVFGLGCAIGATAATDPAISSNGPSAQTSSTTTVTFATPADVAKEESTQETQSSENNAPSTSTTTGTDPLLDDQLTDTEEYSTGSDADTSLTSNSPVDSEEEVSTTSSSPESSPKTKRENIKISDAKILQSRNSNNSTASPTRGSTPTQKQPTAIQKMREIYITMKF